MMEKRTSVERNRVGPSHHGRNTTKEAALEKLRKMEWMRNKQDNWHVVRGSENQWSRKNRHPNPTLPETASASVPNITPSAPPTVNAWTQKKGSALFAKPAEEEEEDEMLKLALKESLKTAEEDNRRQMERMRLNEEIPAYQTCTNGDQKGEKNGDYKFNYPHSTIRSSATEDFVESESSDYEPSNCVRKTTFFNSRVLTCNETFPPKPTINDEPVSPQFNNSTNDKQTEFDTDNMDLSHIQNTQRSNQESSLVNFTPSSTCLKGPSHKPSSDDNASFEPSRPNKVFPPVEEQKYDKREQPIFNDPYLGQGSSTTPLKTSKSTQVSNLNLELVTNLTVGDTRAIKNSFELNYIDPEHNPRHLKNHYFEEVNKQNLSDPRLIPNSLISACAPNFPYNPDDTDRILHSFIRHDPPSSTLISEPVKNSNNDHVQGTVPPDSLYFRQNQELLNAMGSRDQKPVPTSCSVQDPRLTQLNSLAIYGKDNVTGIENLQQIPMVSPHFPYPYTVDLHNNQEAARNVLAMQQSINHFPQMCPVATMPPTHPPLPQHIQTTNQLRYPTTSANIIPPLDTHNMNPQQLQAYYMMLTNNLQHQQIQHHQIQHHQIQHQQIQQQQIQQQQIQHQQIQHAAFGTVHNDPNQVPVLQHESHMLQQLQHPIPVYGDVPENMTKGFAQEHRGIPQEVSKTVEELGEDFVNKATQFYINYLHQQHHQLSTLHPLGQENQPVNYRPNVPWPNAYCDLHVSSTMPPGFLTPQSTIQSVDMGLPKPTQESIGRGRGKLP